MGLLLTGHYFVNDYEHVVACIQLSMFKHIKPPKFSEKYSSHYSEILYEIRFNTKLVIM